MTRPVDELEVLRRENETLRRRLEEAEETIRAIQGGEVDAVVVTHADDSRVLTLDSVDKPYRLVVEQMRQGAAILTPDGTVLASNEAFAALLRRPSGELLGVNLRACVDPSGEPLLDALLRDGLATHVEGEVVLRRRDGTSLPVYLGVSALREGIAGVCLIVADLTEHKRRERLVADEAMARSILERVADAVVVCDADGKVLRASRTAHALCGQNPVLRSFQEMFPLAVLRPGVEESTASALGLDPTWRTETLRGLEVRLTRQDGRGFDLLLSAGPLVVAGGDTVGTVVTLTDITALREAQEELRQRAEALQEADRRKDDFLAMLAHELRNPLAPIRAALDVMRLHGVEDPHLRQGRDVIERQTQQLTRLVDDLLEVARINSGKIKLRRAPVEVARVVSTAVEAMRPAMDARRHALTVSLPDAPLWLDADFARLVQVLGNLLHNAAKYTDEGGRVSVSVAREGHDAVVRVRDSGVGIPPHMLARVFDLFTQVDRSLDRSQGGLGIGLALVRRLVVKHGGQVEAKSEGAGKGSEFVLRFPLIAPPAVEPSRVESGRESETPPSRRVLIVDDNADSAEMMGALMEVCGHTVRVALSGAAALEGAREFHPDVVICDIGLPLMDGYEVARRMRAEPSLAGVRLVALTGYGRPEDLRRSREAGFDAHLVKPFDLAKIAEVFGDG